MLGVAGLFKSVATLADEGPKLINCNPKAIQACQVCIWGTLLAGLLDKDSRLLEDVLRIGPKAIDDLDVILKQGATAEQILKLRFEVRGMTVSKLRQLLERAEMTPSILVELFKKTGMTIPVLEKLLTISPAYTGVAE